VFRIAVRKIGIKSKFSHALAWRDENAVRDETMMDDRLLDRAIIHFYII